MKRLNLAACAVLALTRAMLALTYCTTAIIAASPRAIAAVRISDGATQNMSCSGGVCEPTTTDAVLNVGDLENVLASGDATVTTTGMEVEARNLIVAAPVSWSNSNALTLEAHAQLKIYRPVSVDGSGGLSLTAQAKGRRRTALSFGPHGNITFANLSNPLSIEGVSYTLVGTIAQLAQDVATNPAGNYALASSYDAKNDGTYRYSPVSTPFNGILEGLGNTISNLVISDANNHDPYVGFFAQLVTQGQTRAQLRDIGIVNARVTGVSALGFGNEVGALVGINSGGVVGNCYATGTITGTGVTGGVGGLVGANSIGTTGIRGLIVGSNSSASVTDSYSGEASSAGGLVADNRGVIHRSYAVGSVNGANEASAGGLVGDNDQGSIADSFASGAVSIRDGQGFVVDAAGGLVGYLKGNRNGKHPKAGSIFNSYATGAVSGGEEVIVGGLIGGGDFGLTSDSYSTGRVSAGLGTTFGGVIGFDDDQTDSFEDAYWDTDTSGVTNLSQGAGNIANDPGITGLSTAQLKSGLPQGFNPSIWAESLNVNSGLPYLRDNPPPK